MDSLAHPLTATQIIYLGMQHEAHEAPEATQIIYHEAPQYDNKKHCRICGGKLLLPAKTAYSLSKSWTDENLSRSKDSKYICRACAWFTEGKNRTRIWNANPVLFASQNESKPMTIPDFYNFIKEPFSVPSVFLIRGRDINLIRKHIQWRALDGVTYDRKKTKVLFYGIQLWKDGDKVTGTAVFDADVLVEMIDTMCNSASNFIESFIQKHSKESKKITNWFIQNYTMENLLDALRKQVTPDVYLAAYIASYLVADQLIAKEPV
jgi:hypothetical protein